MSFVSTLVTRVDAYLKKTGQHATGFGIEVANNSALVSRLRAGNVNGKTLDLIADFLDRKERPAKSERKVQ